MKALGPRSEMKMVKNAWGNQVGQCQQLFQVEAADVGTVKPHYLGFNHRSYMFKKEDIGTTIVVYTDGTQWTCWVFSLNWDNEDVQNHAGTQ
ncbi:hypothetical protein KMC60_gp24 [Achromobacter phage vB_AxyP_19-32_Axy11]|uniref:Uncharacterized protein n=2 Tax=Pourcelvirus Axy11 TaxID=2843622 RepID=A0A514CUB4_9CAUD|nr:hypothetical protein KMC60_gp24 [Achromobacter phage vB_AxyP_19-32_Axy11]QDH84056.1 hypothetical protein Axy11_024 [Achromobacter phage vB_AxyP_19-32_Axy11]